MDTCLNLNLIKIFIIPSYRLKDIILKRKIINGTRVHYKPDWDCHGLPIELKALGNTKNVSHTPIRQKAKKFAMEAVQKQKKSFESWGVIGS